MQKSIEPGRAIWFLESSPAAEQANQKQKIKIMKTIKNNPLKKARRSKQIKTVGDAIKYLVDAFSEEGSGDTMGAYILELAAKEVQSRLPARQAEWEAIMKRIDERK